MALNYSVCLRKNPSNRSAAPKAYATAQTNGELTLKQLSHRVAQQTTVSRADVVAVLTATVENMFDGLREGKQVDFGELGKFRLQIYSEGTESLEKFTADKIKGVTIQYLPGEDLKTMFQGLEFTLVPTRKAQAAALRAEKGGKNVVDILGPDDKKTEDGEEDPDSKKTEDSEEDPDSKKTEDGEEDPDSKKTEDSEEDSRD